MHKYGGELVRGYEGLVEVPQQNVLESIGWCRFWHSVCRKGRVDAQVLCIGRKRKGGLGGKRGDIDINADRNQGQGKIGLSMVLLVSPGCRLGDCGCIEWAMPMMPTSRSSASPSSPSKCLGPRPESAIPFQACRRCPLWRWQGLPFCSADQCAAWSLHCPRKYRHHRTHPRHNSWQWCLSLWFWHWVLWEGWFEE